MSLHLLHTVDPMVIGGRLAEARRARRLTQHAVADVLEVARTTIVAIEKGSRRPRAAELITLASLYGREARDFLRPAAEVEWVDFTSLFREAQNGPAAADGVAESDTRRFEQLSRWYLELETITGAPVRRRYPEPYDVSDTPLERAALAAVVAERNRLGLGDGPIGDIWHLLEADVGLRVFAFPMAHGRTAGMFLFTDELGGCIAVNANHSAERQRWTAAREYGHFLTRRFQADIARLPATNRLRERDRFADAFARQLLLPAAGLIRRFDAIRRAKGAPFSPGDLLQLANQFGVSAPAVTWRLEELRLLPAGTWERLQDASVRQPDAERPGSPPAPRPGPVRLPLRYVLLAVQAFTAGLLSEGQLADRLLTDRVGARDTLQHVTTVRQPADAEALSQVILDLSRPLAMTS